MHFTQTWQSQCQRPHQSLVDRAASKLHIRRADVQKYGYNMSCPGHRSVVTTGTTARARAEVCRRRLEELLAEDEETRFKSEAAKHRVDGRLAGHVESQRGVRPMETHQVELQAAQCQQLPQQLINTKVTQFQIMVSRGKGGRHKNKTQESLIRTKKWR